MKTGNTIISVLGGVIVGTALGILFAPDKGTATRKKIAKKGNDVKEEAMGSITDLLGNLSEKCNSIVEKGEVLVQNGIESIQNEIDSAKKQMN
ncbi:YtxH domain-containing protein [Flavobacterium sp. 7A]|uniref:YtxH domain-containing protein n=1 Tax=Flavobacterium sp. 7A TaxID=2940571 RepID=UPI0022277D21|nr:YtxH domain-containing protein [Flavobacterium sp. 7A]MCW2119994.1 gas vesicle protein [Flavobacterium sp. 7A]